MAFPSVLPIIPAVTVIIPTTCEEKRFQFLDRAITSVLNQNDLTLDVIIVVNGDKFDNSLLDHLEKNTKLRIIRLAEGNVSIARYVGVCEARGDFFCFLDDDDEFLPDAIYQRIILFSHNPEADVVVTNGYIYTDHDEPLVPDFLKSEIDKDPSKSFLAFNWFASPASMFRTSRIEPALFNMQYKYFEWTYLFFLLLSKGKTIKYDDCLTYRKYEDHPLSVSKSNEYFLSHPAFLLTLHGLPLDSGIRKIIASNYVSSLNSLSNIQMSQGHLKKAWISHIKCLMNGGWRYLPYTRHLLLARLKYSKER